MTQREITILCIDDEDQICFALKELFRLQGWQTLTAHSVEAGLTAFKEGNPDLVIIDYHMPRVNGVEGVQLLRRLSETVPILVFTIDESQAVADAFLAAGASDFALKPIKAPDIISRVKLHISLLNQQRQSAASASAQPRGTQVKGINQATVTLILDYLQDRTDYLTVDEVANGTGLAYQTAYRYLQYTTQEKITETLSIYGKVGRPKQVYRKL